MKTRTIVTCCIPIVMLLGITIWLIVQFKTIPQQIPTHYGVSGNVDSWGGKGTLFILLVLAWHICLLLLGISLLPKEGTLEITKGDEGCSTECKKKLHDLRMNVMRWISIVIAAMFCYLIVAIATLQSIILIVPLIIILAIIILYMVIKEIMIIDEDKK